MKTDAFSFDLPEDLIAQVPVQPRDQARLLHVGKGLQDYQVFQLPQLLRAGDLLVFNDTRVIPARLMGQRGQARVELMLHKKFQENNQWWVFARPAKRLRLGDRVIVGPGFEAVVIEKAEGGEVLVDFGMTGPAFFQALRQHGQIPLPPYIARPEGIEAKDLEDYQTLFAKTEGAVAAPTAGLHFTPALMETFSQKGIKTAFVTLHVGAGTFLPVKADNVQDHKMHEEYGEISSATVQAIRDAKAKGGRVVAVGTTTLRLLESAVDSQGQVQEFAGETDIFILPGHQFKVVDLLMTNFHLPRSTLFMLVSAFAGLDKMKAAYAHAIQKGYRFYSYGDACLLEKNDDQF